MQRARRAEDKARRRASIVAAARQELASRPFSEVKMAQIARAARIAKGTVFIYFPTKEALFLEVLETRLEAWLDDVDARLASGGGRWTPARVARLLCDTLLEDEPLTQLLSLLSTVLEQNVSVERVLAFKRFLVERLGRTGALLEHRLRLPGGSGLTALMRIYAVVIGAQQLCTEPPAVAAALDHEGLTDLRLDFETEVQALITAVLTNP